MDDINNRGIHRSRGDVIIRSKQELAQRTTELLRIGDIDGNEFQDTVLRDDAENVGPLGLAIAGDEGDTAGARFQHAPTGIVERALGVDGDGLWRRDA